MGTVRYTVLNGEVIAEKRNGVRRQYVPDPLGSTVALLDNTQAQTDTFDYWPYGEESNRTGTTATPFRYVGTWGQYRDSSARDYARARVLDKQKGRWLTEDPLMLDGGLNVYIYGKLSPLLQIDPSGLLPGECCHSDGRPLNCHQICNKARQKPNLDKHGGAGVVCCGNRHCACIFGPPDLAGYKGGTCHAFDKCILDHERQHFTDVDCPPHVDQPWRPNHWKHPWVARECKLRRQSIKCLKNSLPHVHSTFCKKQMQDAIHDLIDWVNAHHCPP